MHGAEFDFDYDLLAELTEASGVPGYEDAIRDIVRRELEPHVDELRGDEMGNVVGTLWGNADTGADADTDTGADTDTDTGADTDTDTGADTDDYEVVVAAHMDEIGFMVRHVDDEGFVALDALGGWDPRVMRAQRVTVHTEDGDVPGVIGSPPPHTQDDDEADDPDVEDMRVDLGLDGEAARERVSVGDLVTMTQRTEVVGEHVTGKALDDRVCVFAMLEAARRVDPDVTVHFAATVQEEVGLRGAQALGVDMDPDLAVALDVTVANDVPGFEDGEQVTRLGDGAAIKLKDASVITNPKVHRRLRRVAEERGVPYQLEVLPRGGTDTASFQRAGGATPVGAISVPTRYLHTVTESAHHADVGAAIDLLAAFLDTETGDHDYSL